MYYFISDATSILTVSLAIPKRSKTVRFIHHLFVMAVQTAIFMIPALGMERVLNARPHATSLKTKQDLAALLMTGGVRQKEQNRQQVRARS